MTRQLGFKSFTASFLLHGSVLLGYVVMSQASPVVKTEELNEAFKMEINIIESVQQAIKAKKPEPVVKEAIPEPVTEKVIPKPEPVVKEAIPKPETVTKKTISKPESVAEKVIPNPEPIAKKTEFKPTKHFVKKPETAFAVKKETKQSSLVENSKELSKEQFIATNFSIIREMVVKNLIYPNMARRMRHEGVVELVLIINIKGELESYDIFKSSGLSSLDKAALKAVESVESLNFPKPNVVSKVILPIGFQLN